MGLTWDDAESIAEKLMEKFPGQDPLMARFTDLHRWVTEMEDFDDDPSRSTEGTLEAIQMAWYELYQQ